MSQLSGVPGDDLKRLGHFWGVLPWCPTSDHALGKGFGLAGTFTTSPRT